MEGYVLMFYNALPTKPWLELLQKEVIFPETRPIIVRGVNVPEPRDVAYHSDHGVHPIIYSRITRYGSGWTPNLLLLREFLQSHYCSTPFLPRKPSNPTLNCVLINRYLNGQDSMGEHSDDESFLGSDPFIITVSLGYTRALVWKKKSNQLDVNRKVATLQMKDSSVMIMLGKSIQTQFSHQVPKTKLIVGVRWSLSFRYHIFEQN